jgi:hypothetical protein
MATSSVNLHFAEISGAGSNLLGAIKLDLDARKNQRCTLFVFDTPVSYSSDAYLKKHSKATKKQNKKPWDP